MSKKNFGEQPELPGFEGQADLDRRLAPHIHHVTRQSRRQIAATRLAHKLAGRALHLERTPAGLLLVDDQTDQIILDERQGGSDAERMAALLLLGAEDRNHIVGTFNTKQDGSTFGGGSALFRPSLRMDPSWMEAMRRRTRNTTRKRFVAMEENLKADPKEALGYAKKYSWAYRPLFVTTTLPELPEEIRAGTVAEVKRYNRAWRNLLKSDWWRQAGILGGIKAIEDKLTADGPFVHGHALLIARRLDLAAFTAAWRAAVALADANLYPGLVLRPASPPDVAAVKPKARRDGEIALDAALDEVCKYLTKLQDLLDPGFDRLGRPFQPCSSQTLLELCRVPRWPRMVEHLGAAREAKPAKRAGLDTSCISVPRNPVPIPNGWDMGGIEPEERARYESALLKNRDPLVPQIRERPPTWRDLIPITNLHDWLQVVAARCDAAIRFRVRQLREQHPDLDVVSLDGTVYRSNEWTAYDQAMLDLDAGSAH